LLLRPARPLLWLGAIGNLLIVVLWAVDRISGLPLGPTPWKPDPVGFADSVSSAFELLLAAGCLALLVRSAGWPRRPPAPRALAAAAVLAVAVLTTLGLLSAVGVGASLLTPSS